MKLVLASTLVLLSVLLLVAFVRPGPTQADLPRVLHVVTYDGKASPPRWQIEVHVEGLDPSGQELAFELDNWGEWTDVDSYVLQDVHGTPPITQVAEEPDWFRLAVPEDWDGKAKITYSLLTSRVHSRAQASKGLLPWRSANYTHGFSSNTLMMPREAGQAIEVDRRLEIRAPKDWTIFTGWGGVSRGSQEIDVPSGGQNTVIVMGQPIGLLDETRGPTHFEIVQFGGEGDLTQHLFETLGQFARDCGETLQKPLDLFRIVVTEPGFGGTRVEGAITIGASTSFLEGGADPYTLHFLGHELFHNWLPGDFDPGNDAMQWFFEGFTEYMSLWHLTRVDLLERSFFATRLLDFERELEGHDEWSDLVFGDPAIRWRRGAFEEIAYKGGALLAFHIDVALRAEGYGGLTLMLRDFVAGEGFDHAWFRQWLDSHGLADFRARVFDGRERPDLFDALEQIGYQAGRREVMLTYFGIESSGGGKAGTVLSIDPEGPSAARDIRVGDQIIGYFPTRMEGVSVDENLSITFGFGLTLFDPNQSGWYVDVLRAGEELQIELEPWLSPGGFSQAVVPGDGDQLDPFFRAPAN